MEIKPLDGIKVLEYGELVAVPYCGRLLAGFGAEVIKIERPGVGDESRRRGPFPDDIPDPEKSGLFLYLNSGKLGITMDITTQAGRQVFKELIKESDIFLEDTQTGMREKLGLGYDSLKDLNSKLIMTSITPFGQTGVYSDYKAYYLNTCHSGGEGYFMPGGTEHLERPPLKAGRFLGDYDSAVNASVATLGALFWRGSSGMGQHVDISKQESMMCLYPRDMCAYVNEGLTISRAEQGYPFGGIMPCKDGYVSIYNVYEHEYQALLRAMGSPEWSREDRFKDVINARQHREEMQAYLLEWTMSHTKEEIYHGAQAEGCPAGVVFTTQDLFDSQQLEAHRFFQEINHPKAGKLKYPSVPFKTNETMWQVVRPAPLLGEHNELIYCQRLGYSKQELVKLRTAGIV